MSLSARIAIPEQLVLRQPCLFDGYFLSAALIQSLK